MSYYDGYAHLLGVPYDDGDHDCYGLLRRYYKDVYDLELPNYARSADFFSDGKDLITPGLLATDFKIVDVPADKLRPGDALFFCVPSRNWPRGQINHLGVFAGNQIFLHHLWMKNSSEEPMTDQWAARIMAVARHERVAEVNANRIAQSPVNLIALLPDHVKRKYGIVTTDVLGTDSGEIRSGPEGRVDHRAEEPAPRPGELPDGGQGGSGAVRVRRRKHVAHTPEE